MSVIWRGNLGTGNGSHARVILLVILTHGVVCIEHLKTILPHTPLSSYSVYARRKMLQIEYM